MLNPEIESLLDEANNIYVPSTTGQTALLFSKNYPQYLHKTTFFYQNIEIDGKIREMNPIILKKLNQLAKATVHIPSGYANYILGFNLKSELRKTSQGLKVAVELIQSLPTKGLTLALGGKIAGLDTIVQSQEKNMISYTSLENISWKNKELYYPKERKATFFIITEVSYWKKISPIVKDLKESGTYVKIRICPRYESQDFVAYPNCKIIDMRYCSKNSSKVSKSFGQTYNGLPIKLYNFLYNPEIEEIASRASFNNTDM